MLPPGGSGLARPSAQVDTQPDYAAFAGRAPRLDAHYDYPNQRQQSRRRQVRRFLRLSLSKPALVHLLTNPEWGAHSGISAVTTGRLDHWRR